MKKILGIDVGTNSIGWSFIENDIEKQTGSILGMGSRIVPMDGREKDFEAGKSVSKAADRRGARGARRLLQRYKLRRSWLIRVLKTLEWFPNNFPDDFKGIDTFNINNFVPYSDQTIAEAKKELGYTNKNGEEKLLNDWIIYFLRTKALTEKISLQELARIIYHFNQRRGFKSSRKENKSIGEDDAAIKYPVREKKVEIITVTAIEESTEKSKLGKIFNVSFKTSGSNTIYSATTIRKEKPDWISELGIELEITSITSKDNTTRYELRLPDRTDWEKMKIALEKDLLDSGFHPGQYHYTHLLADRNYRIKERVIDRSFYQKELKDIWDFQAAKHPELNSNLNLEALIDCLYTNNENKRKELSNKTIYQIIANDIIYYQRDLRSQKHLIAECRYEKKNYTNKNGKQQGFKVLSKSHPSFQEFRIWQDIHNLKIIKLEEKQTNGKTVFDIDETEKYLNFQTKAKLFKLSNKQTSISQDAFLKELSTKEDILSKNTHRWNYPSDKEFKGNETKTLFRKVFKRHNYTEQGEALMNNEKQFDLLWHILYSLNDEKQIQNAVKNNFSFEDDLAKHIAKLPEFKSEYASYSYKAINKLLSFMRCGEFWNEANLNKIPKERIEVLLQEGINLEVNKETGEIKKQIEFSNIEQMQGLPTYISCYIVYGRHSEKENESKYDTADELKLLEHGELRNPIVEQITNETLQVVKDVWKQYGRPDEIHIELARDLKKNVKERDEITRQNTKNEAERKRIVAILKELQNTNPDSISDIEKLRLWEETANQQARDDYFNNIKFSKEPTKTEIEKYKLWGEQNHISPYTGKVIPLSKLFNREYYEIEHIIPKARFFDDSFANKTICETWVNKFKDKSTAMELINEYGGTEQIQQGQKFKLLSPEEFIAHVKQQFRGKKKWHLLSESIPEGFIERQLNDTRYIGRKLSELLHPAAKEDVIFTSGNITSDLKEKWGLHRVWKEILKPRFERLEKITGEKLIDIDIEHNNIHFKKDYKRIDHRHHALDALIIAATSRSHIQYLNTLNAQNNDGKEKQKYAYLIKSKVREFVLPWSTFTKDARKALQGTIVSHKSRTRLITKGFNVITKFIQDENGKWVKKAIKQEKGSLISVRKSMFKEPLGKILIAEYKQKQKINAAIKIQLEFNQKHRSNWKSSEWRIARTEVRKQINELLKNCEFDEKKTLKFIEKYPLKDKKGNTIVTIDLLKFTEVAAKRVALDDSFDEKKIDKIPYANHASNKTLANILKTHLKENKTEKEAFTGEGLEQLAKKVGKPITKVTTYEAIGSKIPFKGKLVEADKGSNLFFVIYESIETGERIINEKSSIPLLEAIERKANRLPIADDKEGYKTIILSPNDLVYVPEPNENVKTIDWERDKKKICERIYKVVSFSKGQIFFIPHFISSPIVDTSELGANNKSETSWDKISIKKICVKIKIDRLGNISL